MPPVSHIVVGYRTRVAADVQAHMPEFKAPSNYKDAAKIQADIAEKQAAFLLAAKDMPYTGTFDEVHLYDQKANRAMAWSHKATEEEGKPPVAVRVLNFLLKYHPKAWDNNTHGRKVPEVAFLGFDPRTFLKILGLECTRLAISTPPPLGLWYSNSDHRDIGEAVMPKECKGLTLPYVLKFRRPLNPDRAKQWDELLDGWNGPGETARKDAKITIELANQLGFFED